MIVRHLDDILGTDREVHAPTWTSRRLSLADDGMGFSMHDTVLYAGTETKMWYQNHLEGVYCIEGEGTIEDLATGEIHEVRPGTIYLLNDNDRHVLRATTQLRMVCTFNPPVTGQEVHDENGAYPLVTSGPERPAATKEQHERKHGGSATLALPVDPDGSDVTTED